MAAKRENISSELVALIEGAARALANDARRLHEVSALLLGDVRMTSSTRVPPDPGELQECFHTLAQCTMSIQAETCKLQTMLSNRTSNDSATGGSDPSS